MNVAHNYYDMPVLPGQQMLQVLAPILPMHLLLCYCCPPRQFLLRFSLASLDLLLQGKLRVARHLQLMLFHHFKQKKIGTPYLM